MKEYFRSDIAHSYKVFDLPLGTPLEEVERKYKMIAFRIHPDRVTDPALKTAV